MIVCNYERAMDELVATGSIHQTFIDSSAHRANELSHYKVF